MLSGENLPNKNS
uniref:Uncharacterized protein n=1 Tax=Anguilla anguilla TaxID=7936 RepID=A0A0E9XP04_ANGAN